MEYKIYPYRVYSSEAIIDIKKYSGKTVSEVMLIEPSYIEWCISNHDRFFITPEELFVLNNIYENKYSFKYNFKHSTLIFLCHKYDSMIYIDLNYDNIITRLKERAIDTTNCEQRKNLLKGKIYFNHKVNFDHLNKKDKIDDGNIQFKLIITPKLDYNDWKHWLVENETDFNNNPLYESDIKYGVATQIKDDVIYHALYCVDYSKSKFSFTSNEKIMIRDIYVGQWQYYLRSDGKITRYLIELLKEIIYDDSLPVAQKLIYKPMFTNKKTKIDSIYDFKIGKEEGSIYLDFKVNDEAYNRHHKHYCDCFNLSRVYEAKKTEQSKRQQDEYNILARIDDVNDKDWCEDNFDALTDGQYGRWDEWRNKPDGINDALGM